MSRIVEPGAAVGRAVAAARAELSLSNAGELPLRSRELVWAAIGPRATGRHPGRPLPAHMVRAEIAFRTCERVLPLWERERLGDDLPRRVLDLAPLALIGEASEVEAKTAAGRLWGRTENLTQLAGDPDRLTVGFACAKSIDVALYDEEFDREHLTQREAGRDLFEVDVAFLAAIAEAGGPWWEERADAVRRRAFWTWWLEECVPAALKTRSPA
jgi:Immunity protein Imm5